MKVLILTQYYLPENPPGAHRLSCLAKSLQQAGHSVEILTTFPNYPNLKAFEGYKVKWYKKEITDGITVHRSWIYLNPKKRLSDRILSFLSFQVSSLLNGMAKIQKPDVIVCLSPPIFTCFTGVFLKFRYRSRLVLNIADLWPESGIKLGILKNRFIIRTAEYFESYFYRKSDGIACQTMGILNFIQKKVKEKKLIWFRNGVDFDYYENIKIDSAIVENYKSDDFDLTIAYTGLVGYAQGLELLVRAAKILNCRYRVRFLIIGDGPKLNELKESVKSNGMDNFVFTGNQPKHLMPTYLSLSNVSIVPLIKTDIYLGALPSKIFDSFAVRKTVLLGVDGEAKELFCDRFQCAYYFEPENENHLAERITEIIRNRQEATERGDRGYEVMKNEFNRKIINQGIIKFLEEINTRTV